MSYDSESLGTMEGLEHVRENVGMYIGSSGEKGLHHLVFEVVDNSIDEAMSGHCEEITVHIHEDNSVTVEDDGRGIPVGDHEDSGKPGVELVMTELMAGGKFDDNSYEISGGLHGVGVSVVNALCSKMEVTVRRDGKVWYQEYEYARPRPEGKLEVLGETQETGTKVRFWPDGDVFETTQYDYETLSHRLRQLAFLNPGVEISITDERQDESSNFHYEGGITEYVEYLNEGRDPLHDDVIYVQGSGGRDNGIIVEAALQFTENVQTSIHSFANNIHTEDGGTHITGFKTSLTRIVNDFAQENGHLKEIEGNLSGEDIREGLTAVVSVKHPDPQFQGQTKRKLGNTDVRSVVSTVMREQFDDFIRENPDVGETVCKRAVQAAKARKAAEKAQEVTRRDTALNNTALPGKLTDCQISKSEGSELFVVEGDSAGGSAKQARNQERQAVLPIKGKILNVEKHRLDRILENNEISDLITAIGAGIGDEFDLSNVRYSRIILLVDADVDGAHIRTLLLTFLYRHMPELLEEGMVFAAQPPLYRIKCGKDTFDVMTEEERRSVVQSECDGSPDSIQRFKGLGEMNPQQLWETTMDPERRILRRLTIDDGAKADRVFSVLMGDDVSSRKNFISDNAKDADWIDI